MILLDENIPEDQCRRLRALRIRFRQIGQDMGRQGMKDDQHIIPLLHELVGVTFVTRDLGFFDRRLRHKGYCLACFAVESGATADLIRQFLRDPRFRTKKKRMGKVLWIGPATVRIWSDGQEREQTISWSGGDS
jgi:hypothetical protein